MNIRNLSLLLNILALLGLREQLPTIIFVFCIICNILFLFQLKKNIFLTLFKLSALSISIFVLWKIHRHFLVTDFGISLVMLLSSLKLLELESIEDFFNMFLILITVEACLLITSPVPLVFIFSFVKISLYFYFLLRIQNFKLGALNIKRIILLLTPAIGFSILLYFAFPRFTQGFNTTLSLDSFKAVNHNLDFKSLKDLSLSDNKVFTVYKLPKEKMYLPSLYWRTNVLWDFNRGSWRSGVAVFKINTNNVLLNTGLFLKILTEKNYYDYIPHLDTNSNVLIAGKVLKQFSDNTFKLAPASTGRFEITQETNFLPIPLTLKMEREKGLNLNIGQENTTDVKIYSLLFGNKDIKKISTSDRLNSVHQFFINRNFEYSKTPNSYSSLQEFILSGHLGYCSHFASAYAYLLRQAHIPSRIVIGYQGGEINTFDNSVIVRERDSHAWVEYLSDDNIWIRIDPTEFVAPERISLGALVFFDTSFNFKIFNTLEHFIDATSNKLSSSVFDFDIADQKKLFKNKSGAFFVITLVVFLTFYYFFTRISILPSVLPAQKRYNKFMKLYAKKECPKLFSETAKEYGARLSLKFPNESIYIQQETDAYINFFYRT